MRMDSQVFEKLRETQRLPSPRGVALEILRLADRADTSAGDIARVVQTDPATAARILKLANSPLAGAQREINSVVQAVVSLGVRTVKFVSLGFSLIRDHQQGECSSFDYTGFWSVSLARAVAMRNLAGCFGRQDADVAFTFGLLSLIGRLALVTAYPMKYERMMRDVGHLGDLELAAAEARVFGIHPDVLSVQIVSDWGMPYEFCESVAHLREGTSGADREAVDVTEAESIIEVGIVLSQIMTQASINTEQTAIIEEHLGRRHVSYDRFAAIFEAITHEWSEAGKIFMVPTHDLPSLEEIERQAEEQRAKLAATESA